MEYEDYEDDYESDSSPVVQCDVTGMSLGDYLGTKSNYKLEKLKEKSAILETQEKKNSEAFTDVLGMSLDRYLGASSYTAENNLEEGKKGKNRSLLEGTNIHSTKKLSRNGSIPDEKPPQIRNHKFKKTKKKGKGGESSGENEHTSDRLKKNESKKIRKRLRQKRASFPSLHNIKQPNKTSDSLEGNTLSTSKLPPL